jgi:pyruvate kinase
MRKNINILCTLGPSTLNKNFINLALNNNVSLLRLNLSHLSSNQIDTLLKKKLNKYLDNICIDTEGAQIRTNVSKKKYFKKNSISELYKNSKKFSLYPHDVFSKLKIGDELDVGFEGLRIKLLKKGKDKFRFKIVNPGYLEKNKGVHVINRKIKLQYITEKDLNIINLCKKYNIKNYALSFCNSVQDIEKFDKLIGNKNKIFKIETKNALKNFNKIVKKGKNFLIDRGDLSKEIGIEQIPIAQRKILQIAKRYKNKNIFIATNFLESMISKPYPTRAEVNDIYNSLELGAKGLVLAAETAIGKYPIECIKLINKIIKAYNYNR